MPASCNARAGWSVARTLLAIAELGRQRMRRAILQALAERELVFIIDRYLCMALARCQQELAEFGSIVPLEALPDGLRGVTRRVDGKVAAAVLAAPLAILSGLRSCLPARGCEKFPAAAPLLRADLLKPVPNCAHDDPWRTAAFNLNLLGPTTANWAAISTCAISRTSAPYPPPALHRNSPQIDATAAGHHPRCRFPVSSPRDHLTEACHKFHTRSSWNGPRRRIRLRPAGSRVAFRRASCGRMSAVVEFREVAYDRWQTSFPTFAGNQSGENRRCWPQRFGKDHGAKMVNGLVFPSTAKRWWSWLRLHGPRACARIGYAFRRWAFPHFVGATSAWYPPGGLGRAEDLARVLELLKSVGLEPALYAGRYRGSFPRPAATRGRGCARWRLSILLFDEPFRRARSGDAWNYNASIRPRREVRKTSIFVTHDVRSTDAGHTDRTAS
jgi:hypothetical protein